MPKIWKIHQIVLDTDLSPFYSIMPQSDLALKSLNWFSGESSYGTSVHSCQEPIEGKWLQKFILRKKKKKRWVGMQKFSHTVESCPPENELEIFTPSMDCLLWWEDTLDGSPVSGRVNTMQRFFHILKINGSLCVYYLLNLFLVVVLLF